MDTKQNVRELKLMPRGGKREGAGRPQKTPGEMRVTLNCRIRESLKDWLSNESERTGKSIGEIIDIAVERLQSQGGANDE